MQSSRNSVWKRHLHRNTLYRWWELQCFCLCRSKSFGTVLSRFLGEKKTKTKQTKKHSKPTASWFRMVLNLALTINSKAVITGQDRKLLP